VTPRAISLHALFASLIVFSAAFVVTAPSADSATCEGLATLALLEITIILAKVEPSGTFTPPKPARMPGSPLTDLPAFCCVVVEVKPTPDSDIKFEVWMPASNWNGKFIAMGNGGWSGEIWYFSMGEALRCGYVIASIDTGYESSSGD